MWMGASRDAATVLNPVVQLLRPISPIAWIPVAIVFFGVGNLAPVFLVFLGAFFPIVVDGDERRAQRPAHVPARGAQLRSLARGASCCACVLPAALPEILIGLRIALGIAWIVVVAAEMIAVDSGLGYLIIDARNAGKRYDLVVAGMLLIGVVGLAPRSADRARLETLRAVRWGFRRRAVRPGRKILAGVVRWIARHHRRCT